MQTLCLYVVDGIWIDDNALLFICKIRKLLFLDRFDFFQTLQNAFVVFILLEFRQLCGILRVAFPYAII